MTSDGNNLPKGWISTILGEVTEVSKEKVSPDDLPGVHYVGLEHIQRDAGKLIGHGTSDEVKSTKSRFQKGDVLYGKLRPYLNKVCIPDFDGVCSTDILVFKQNEWIDSRFLQYTLLNRDFVSYANSNVSGVQHPRTNEKTVGKYTFLLPPLTEQHRIVNKIEELFTQLDAGIDLLQMTRVLLNQYRQSVLKAAFEGKLTEEWREANSGKFESIEAMLQRMFKDPKTKLSNESDLPSDVPTAPILPNSWRWARVANVSASMDYGTSEKATGPTSGVPVLRMGNIQSGKLDFGNLKFFPTGWSEFKKFRLEPGDVLFNRTNSAELVGKTAVYKKHHPPAVFASYLIRVKVNIGFCHPEIMSHFINSCFGRAYIKSVVSQQVGQANVNGTKLSLMPVPLIPIREQIEILKQVDTQLSVADKFEESLSTGLTQTETIKQAILAKAFQGKLVPQDPADEPASKLLERIKAERSGDTPRGRGRKPRQTKMF